MYPVYIPAITESSQLTSIFSVPILFLSCADTPAGKRRVAPVRTGARWRLLSNRSWRGAPNSRRIAPATAAPKLGPATPDGMRCTWQGIPSSRCHGGSVHAHRSHDHSDRSSQTPQDLLERGYKVHCAVLSSAMSAIRSSSGDSEAQSTSNHIAIVHQHQLAWANPVRFDLPAKSTSDPVSGHRLPRQ
jgi:hypothetical protein